MGSGELDALARDLATGEISRRAALRRLVAGLVASAIPSGLLAEAAEAACPPARRCEGGCCPKGARCTHAGKCKCENGKRKCGRKCVDLDTSIKHCGECGNACADGQVCLEGECVTQICSPGQNQACYTGPPGTQNEGVCHGGTQTCNAQGTGYGPCQGEVTPSTEICGSGVDEDCDGQIDEGCCTPDPPATTCAGRECGTVNNNCGQPVDCGSCSGGDTCTPEGQCAPCVPECQAGTCGDDGCGGTCLCAEDEVCESGTCVPGPECSVPADCPGSDTTCQTRTCNGGECGFTYASPATVCSAPTCTGGVQTNAANCDGSGGCPPGSQVSCSPYVCGPSTCKTVCASNPDCAAGFTCAGGACKKAQGSICVGDSECASGFCRDGVCCGSACTGVCEKCNQPGRVGICDPVPAGTDPDNECPSGNCNGARACA